MNKNNISLYILMLLAMFTWGIAWSNAKFISKYNLSFNNLVFLRFLLGCISLLPFIKLKNIYKIKFSHIIYLIIISILFFFYNIAFFKGTEFGLAGKGAILVTTINPIITLIIVSIIKRKISFKEICGIFLGCIGGFLIMDIFDLGFNNIFNIDNYYFLICALTWGIITVLTSYTQRDINSYLFIFLCYLFTTIIAFPFSNIGEINFQTLDIYFYINFALLSLGAMSFGTSIYMYSTPILGPVKSSVFIFSVPFIAAGTAWLFLNEALTYSTAIGGILSLMGIYIVNKK